MSSADATAMVSAFASDPNVRTALEDGIATGLGISASMVSVTGVTAGRRLAERRLQDTGSVQVNYVITVPEGSGQTLTAADITGGQTALKDGINTALDTASLSYTVTELSAPAPVMSTTTIFVTTTTAEAGAVGAARRVASAAPVLGLLALVVGAGWA